MTTKRCDLPSSAASGFSHWCRCPRRLSAPPSTRLFAARFLPVPFHSSLFGLSGVPGSRGHLVGQLERLGLGVVEDLLPLVLSGVGLEPRLVQRSPLKAKDEPIHFSLIPCHSSQPTVQFLADGLRQILRLQVKVNIGSVTFIK